MTFTFWQDMSAWKKACRITLVCLIGCSIGDFGTIIVAQIYFPNAAILPVMGLAMVNGLITSVLMETAILHFREHFSWGRGLNMAFTMSFLSMIVMELAENATDYFLTNGTVPPSDPWYWISLLFSLGAGFVVPLPYNYYKFKKYHQTCCHTTS